MKKGIGVILLALASVCVSARADYACGLEAARERNREELSCYHAYGPKSEMWSMTALAPLDECLATVKGQYSVSIEQCNAQDMPAGAPPEPADPHNVALIAAGIISMVMVFILP